MKKRVVLLLVCVGLLSNVGIAATYYAATTGDDSRTAQQAQNIDTPQRTVAHGVELLGPGDTLLIREGTYPECLNNYYQTIPTGTSWDAAVTIAAYPGESVTLRPDANSAPDVSEVLRIMNVRYIVFENLVLDGVNVNGNVVKITYMGSDPNQEARHIRIKGCELMNAPGMGILGGDSCEFVNLKIHDNGLSDFDHGIYDAANATIIEGCDIYRNAGWGVHVYDGGPNASTHRNMIVRNNRIHDNARLGDRGSGIILGAGAGHMAYNNLIWGNAHGIDVMYGGATDIKVYNNTIFNNLGNGITVWATNTIIENNIIYQNGGSAIEDLTGDGSVGTVADHNLMEDPSFISTDPSSVDFLRPADGSAAIDGGVDLSADGVITDVAGIERPQGTAYDIGAYEYSNTQTAVRQFPISRIAHCAPIDGTIMAFDIQGKKLGEWKFCSLKSISRQISNFIHGSGMYLEKAVGKDGTTVVRRLRPIAR